MGLCISQALQKAVAELDAVSDSARLDAELLLAETLGVGRVYLFAHAEAPVTDDQLMQFQSLVNRRKQHEPIAYLLGRQGFWTLCLRVDRATLIPRPETELLVEHTLDLCRSPSARILDLGTGSGAIALALAVERPGWRIDAVDRCEQALSVAMKNRDDCAVQNLNLYQSDWFTEVGPDLYDVIVSNPPYIAEQDEHIQQGDLVFEPRTALVAAENGLADLCHIIDLARQYLVPSGWLAVEHGYQQATRIRDEMMRAGYVHVHSLTDLSGHERVTAAQWLPAGH